MMAVMWRRTVVMLIPARRAIERGDLGAEAAGYFYTVVATPQPTSSTWLVAVIRARASSACVAARPPGG